MIYRSLIPLLAGTVLLLSACGNNNNKQVEQQHGKDTSHVAVDTISPKIKIYSDRLATNPKDADAYWNRGKLELLQKNLTTSFADLNQAVKLDSTKDGYYSSLADVDFLVGHTRDAKAAFEKCISLNPLNLDALLKLSEIYLDVRKYKDAEDLADRALKIDKHQANAYFIKGLIFLEDKDTVKAASSMQTAIEQNPSFFNAYIQLGLIYSNKRSIHALDYFNTALNIQPNNVEPYYDKGMFYQQIGDYSTAMQTYQQALQINPNYKSALYNMAYLFFINKDYNKSLDYFTKTINSDSTYTLAYYGRGECYENLNDFTKAGRDYAHALKQNPDLDVAKEALAEVKAKMHK